MLYHARRPPTLADVRRLLEYTPEERLEVRRRKACRWSDVGEKDEISSPTARVILLREENVEELSEFTRFARSADLGFYIQRRDDVVWLD